MITMSLAKVKPYSAAQKYRAVLWQYFSPTARALAERAEYGSGLTADDLDLYFPLPANDPEASILIGDAVNWALTKSTPIKEGRFNNSEFRALYSAKEPQTAEAELRHWAGIGKEYVLFLIVFSGTLADLRPALDQGLFRMPMDHKECRTFGSQARHEANGVAAYSVRRPGGSCCAIFEGSIVTPGQIAHRGFL